MKLIVLMPVLNMDKTLEGICVSDSISERFFMHQVLGQNIFKLFFRSIN